MTQVEVARGARFHLRRHERDLDLAPARRPRERSQRARLAGCAHDDSAGGGDDHSGHDHDECHSSDGATATTPAVLVAALAALAYA